MNFERKQRKNRPFEADRGRSRAKGATPPKGCRTGQARGLSRKAGLFPWQPRRKTGRGHFSQHYTSASQRAPFTEFLAKMKLGRLQNTEKTALFRPTGGEAREKGNSAERRATQGNVGPKVASRAFSPGDPGEKRAGSIFPCDRFTVRNPFTATFSVFCVGVCASLPKFARPTPKAGRQGEKEKARRFFVSL